jgi:peptide/nickel transport system permease protein
MLACLLVLVSFGVFALVYLAPGDPLDAYLGSSIRTPQLVAHLRHEFHLDKSFLDQYWLWLRGALHLNFGTSVATMLPVSSEIKQDLPSSLYLGAYAYILSMVLGIGLGVLAGIKRQQKLDRSIVGTAVVALSMPAFVSSILLIYALSVVVPIFPASGPGAGVFDEIWHLTLPAVALAMTATGYIAKHARAATISVLEQDYVTFARARGLRMRRVFVQYILRNALIPVVTVSGLMLAWVITGAVLVEAAFSLPGIGQLLEQSATQKDIPTIQAIALVVAVIIMLANLLADIAYVIVDPRIRLGGDRQ